MTTHAPQQNTVQVTGHLQEAVGNPSPLGLAGLAMVTFVACSSKLGITDGTAMIIPWAIFLEQWPSWLPAGLISNTTTPLEQQLFLHTDFSGFHYP